MDASSTLRAALGPGAPRGPVDRLRTGHPLIAEPEDMDFKNDSNKNIAAVGAVYLRLGLESD